MNQDTCLGTESNNEWGTKISDMDYWVRLTGVNALYDMSPALSISPVFIGSQYMPLRALAVTDYRKAAVQIVLMHS